MNMLAAEAELAVRDSRWGEGIGGVATQDQDFVQLNVKLNASAYFASLKKLSEQQEEFGRKMVSKLLSS